MPTYKRLWVPGGTYFVTIVTHHRQPVFADELNVTQWRHALAYMIHDMPSTVLAGVVLHDHVHVMIALPQADSNLSSRIGRAKAAFSRTYGSTGATQNPSRHKHRESEIWQRRFHDHLIRNDNDFQMHLDYIHYNPVKHGYVKCPSQWKHSSFKHWVDRKVYDPHWACNSSSTMPNFDDIAHTVGE